MSQSFDNSPPKAVTSYTKEQFYAFDLALDGRLLLSHGLRTTDVVAITDAR
jgi:hypothetical protein